MYLKGKKVCFILFFVVINSVFAQIPSDKVIENHTLSKYLTTKVKAELGLREDSAGFNTGKKSA